MIQNFYILSKLISVISIACWLFILGMIVFNQLQKNKRKVKVWILYLLNSSVLYLANKDFMHALSSASQLETLPNLTSDDVSNSVFLSDFNAVVVLFLVSFLSIAYSYWVLKYVEMKRILALFLINAGILIVGMISLYRFLCQLVGE